MAVVSGQIPVIIVRYYCHSLTNNFGQQKSYSENMDLVADGISSYPGSGNRNSTGFYYSLTAFSPDFNTK